MDLCHPHYHNVVSVLSKYMINIPNKQFYNEPTAHHNADLAVQNSDLIHPEAEQRRNALTLCEMRWLSLINTELIVMTLLR